MNSYWTLFIHKNSQNSKCVTTIKYFTVHYWEIPLKMPEVIATLFSICIKQILLNFQKDLCVMHENR